MSDEDPPANDGPRAQEARLQILKQEHADLDHAILMLERTWASDQLSVARMQKRKLALKDQITELEDQLTPDIIA